MTEPNGEALFDLLVPTRDWRPDVPSAVRLLGLCWIGAAGWIVGSDLSFVFGLGLAVLGMIVRPLTTVAVGHAALIVLVPDPFSASALVTFGLFESGLLLLLVSERPTRPIVAVLTVIGAAGLAAAAGLLAVTAGLAAAGMFIIAVLAAASALLYRYERTAVDRIVAARSSTDDEPQTTHS